MTVLARAIIWEVALRRNVSPQKIISACKKDRVAYARAEVARRLFEHHYRIPKIAAILHHDQSTIFFYLGLGRKKLKPEVVRWRKPYIKYLALIRNLPLPDEMPPSQPRRRLIPYAGAEL